LAVTIFQTGLKRMKVERMTTKKKSAIVRSRNGRWLQGFQLPNAVERLAQTTLI